MPRSPQACIVCRRMCRGTRCRQCAKARGAYSRVNAKAQRMTVAVKRAVVQRGSWWVGKSPEDFTALAQVMVVPNDTAKSYNWKQES